MGRLEKSSDNRKRACLQGECMERDFLTLCNYNSWEETVLYLNESSSLYDAAYAKLFIDFVSRYYCQNSCLPVCQLLNRGSPVRRGQV
jgi:hypothetical protein